MRLRMRPVFTITSRPRFRHRMAKEIIKRVNFFKAVSPLSRPLADSTHELREVSFIVTRIETSSGITGDAYLLSFHYSPHAIAGALRDIRPMAEGFAVNETARFTAEWEKESEYFGNPGIHRWAIGSINIAMWDAWAKSLGQPVWKLFDVRRQRVPLYG